MEKIHFMNSDKIYKGTTDFVNQNVISIEFEQIVPTYDELCSGFEILNEHNSFVQASYIDYKTIYRTYKEMPQKIELSNDGSTYRGYNTVHYRK